ncbi:MAG: FlgD immunoglobulin-like domain containing protein [Candidatus Cloacimonetes bacterium]|nr:FlgD immunoglobulin-like domain containing protein [Candidatus Cloacimonadota bacterium]
MGAYLFAQVVPITFHLYNVESSMPNPPTTPWIFDTDDPGWVTHDGNPFTVSPVIGYPLHNYAYKWFYSTDDPGVPAMDPTDSWCIEENLPYIDGTDNFRIEFELYHLTALQKMNMVVPGAAWNIVGQAGDRRVYTGGVGKIYYNDGDGEDLVLYVDNCVLNVYVNYPSVAQMQELVASWTSPIGTGGATEVEGWGTVNVALSDPDWVATFADPAVGNRIDFIMSSVDHTLQGEYGYYSFDVGLISAEHDIQQGQALVPLNPIVPVIVDFPDLDVEFEFSDAIGGGDNQDLNNLNVFYNFTEPDGIFPPQILSVLPHFWDFNTDLAGFATTIVFDLTGMSFGSSNNWKILYRSGLSDTWQVWEDFSIIDANKIRANGVNSFSEWTIGNTEDITLPVEMTSFLAYVNSDQQACLQWITESETNLRGYNIYRGNEAVLDDAINLNQFVEAANSSTTHTYEFTDPDQLEPGNYYYWLSAEDLDGSSEYFGPVTVNLINPGDNPPPPDITQKAQIRVYPNPFNPSTQISVYVPEAITASCQIYNLKGELVSNLPVDKLSAGWNRMNWNGLDGKGQKVTSGIYFVTVHGNGVNLRSKLAILK